LPVAYLVSANQDELPIERIRAEVSGSLPEYMVPAAFVRLNALPKTPNGKVDREALPAPQFEGHLIRETAPRDPIERELLEIWQEVLPGKSIGIDDDFFEIGGDSLEASLMALEIERRFGVDFPLSIFIDNRTIAQLAERVRAPGEPSSSLVTIQRGGSALPLFVVPGGYGNVLFLRHLAHRLGPGRPLYSLQSTRSAAGLRTYYREVGEVAPAYLAEIRRAQPQGPYLLAGYSFGGYVALEMAHLLRAAREEVALLIMLDTYPPGPRRRATALERLRLHTGNLSALGPRGWPRYLAGRVRSVLLTSTRLPLIRSVLRAVNYLPTEPMVASRIARLGYNPPPYAGRVIVIRARRREPHIRWDPMDRWPHYVTGELTFLDVDGSHGTILQEPNVQQVADHIRMLLADAPLGELHEGARPSAGAPSRTAPIPSEVWREGEE
jgi:thioesterase domain-containing protein/acyl carrier protein